MSFDSIAQYGQAMAGQYTDWHPPLISILLHFVLALGGGVSLFMLAQCLAGVFGVRAFATACLRRLFGERMPPRRAAWLSLAVLLLLLVPPSPLAFYLMTFWKDSFALVLVLWIGALALRERLSPSVLAVLIVLAAAWGQVRHNSIVTLPFLGMVL